VDKYFFRIFPLQPDDIFQVMVAVEQNYISFFRILVITVSPNEFIP
jgi:hypothetical protein